MNKWILILIFGLFFLGFVSGAVVDEEILKAFDNGDGKVRVIVKMSEPRGIIARSFAMISRKEVIDENKIKRRFGNIVSIEMSLKELEKLEYVEILGVDKMVHIFLQDARAIIGAESVGNLNISEISINGSQTAVCVIDTGVDSTHPDLSGKLIAQHCFCSANEGGNSSCCSDGTNESNNAIDNNGHGTHVAGIVAATGGIDGIAVGANIVAVKVLNSSGIGFDSDIKAAIEWCSNDTQISLHNISVISLSLGGGQYNNSLNCFNADAADIQSAINNAVAKNISVVIATGNTVTGIYNNATAGIASPSCLYNTTKVTASNKSDSYAAYAFRHTNFPDILVAPGGSANDQIDGINSTKMGGGYVGLMGTSMATPMVAGAIALINQYLGLSGQTKSPSEIRSTLNKTGTILDDSANSGYNFSRINVYDAILSLDIDAPNVTLVSPIDDHINPNQNYTFVCNATDWQLANVTLKIWNSTGPYYNATDNLTGTANETNFNLTDMPFGSYNWNCLVTDNQGYSDFASANFSLTIGGISTTLLSPADKNYTAMNDTNFSCKIISEANYELSNVTFYLWNSSGNLTYNLTQNISGFENTTVFNFTFSDEGNYSWNCLGVNNASNESWGDSNFTIVYDTTNPNITLISLPSSETSNSVSKSFTFNVSDNNLDSCSLIIGGIINSTNSSINVSVTQSFSQTFTPGTYDWKINCSDLAGNVNSSGENSFTITAPVIVTSSSSSSSGGSSSITVSSKPKVYVATTNEVSAGYTRSLKKDEKVNFSIFDFTGGQHLLTIVEVGIDYVNLTIESEPINLKLGIGQSIKLNLTSAIYYDLFIKLNAIVDDKAELTIQSINEAIEVKVVEVIKEEIVETEVIVVKDYFWVVLVLIIILVSIAFVVIMANRKRLKGKGAKKEYDKKSKETKT